MQRIAVINVKGGCGKTTISTNLASLYASKGYKTVIYDYDPQGSSMRWLKLRDSSEAAAIHGITAHSEIKGQTKTWQLRLPPETERVIIDTPPGLHGPDLIDQLDGVNTILIPVLPSSIDMYATADFIRDLLLRVKIRSKNIRVGIIANRTRKNTIAFAALKRFLDSLKIPVIAQLRDTQNYIRATEAGLGVHELQRRFSDIEQTQWTEIYNWLEDITPPPNTEKPDPESPSDWDDPIHDRRAN